MALSGEKFVISEIQGNRQQEEEQEEEQEGGGRI